MGRWIVLAALVPVITSCGGDDGDGASATLPAMTVPMTTAPAPTTSAAPTTAAPTTAVPTTTEPVVTTTTAPLPVPMAAPAEDAVEPYVELGSIEIPKLGIDKPLLEGVTLHTLDEGPGHWPGTAMPGQIGNVVVAGHRVSHDRPFRNLDKLVAGDTVLFHTADGTFTYRVDSVEIVQPDALWIVDQTAAYTATLFACHPPGSTRERIVVHLSMA